jgi:prepilin-type N-terminal cleavage/methylation domain-containing protein
MLAHSSGLVVHELLCKDREIGAKNYNRGFTVVELLVVLMILVIVAMVAIPMAGSAAGVQVRSAANMIAADLEYAKSMAIARAQNFSVVFDSSQESYQIEDSTGTVIAHPVKKGSNYVVDLPGEGLDKVNIVSALFDSTGTVKFDYFGSPYNGNDSPLNSGVITLQTGVVTITIAVEPVTGFISIAN